MLGSVHILVTSFFGFLSLRLRDFLYNVFRLQGKMGKTNNRKINNKFVNHNKKQDTVVSKMCYYLQLYIQFLLLQAQMQQVKKEPNFSSYNDIKMYRGNKIVKMKYTNPLCKALLFDPFPNMTIPVKEFQVLGYEIRKVFA